MTVLGIENVSKSYGDVHSVQGVSLNLNEGERVALLGHNGAGKTTLMRMVLGLTPLTSGRISVLGMPPGSRKARTAIGFLPESVAFHGALTGREQLHHFARLKGVKRSVADDLLERVGLTHAMNRKIRTYSKGMRQRIGLAQALLGQPRLALLDEPTSGLDPISRHEFYDIVDDLAKTGTAVLLSSHALTELESRTDRIAIMSQGHLLANDSLSALREAARLPIKVCVKATAETADDVAARLGGTRVNGASVSLEVQQEGKVSLLGQITGLGDLVKDIDVTPASLEELYRHYSVPKQEGK
ncbi:MAG TPA: ABC transporter ATP-binding protein [Rhodobacteraceae bacterium]|nr:ABC transporter ATP-binding protein [Paracoccaceae bacterium]